MKLNKICYIVLALIALNHSVLASQQDDRLVLGAEREQVVRQYILDLEKADYQGISALFDEGGMVVSTSRGNVEAKEFFYGFLPHIESATTELHQAFISRDDNNRYAARFHFSFKLKDGEVGDGEYVDEFVFSENSTALKAVYMFENLKFKENS